jgi:hypothetical protein
MNDMNILGQAIDPAFVRMKALTKKVWNHFPKVFCLQFNILKLILLELMFYRSPHAPVRFGPGGRIIYVQPDFGMSLVCIEDTKKFYKDMEGRRYVEMIEVFKG